ncbi:hypothetical protein R3P38DRAFT_3168136 [Favolaschia claudopus]|uniref:Uncharacterized protein n=1 Tax=Favolaschia claudopus TaxID=2862362 RepID=A0AAW0E5Q5_9AGAR
MSESSSDYAPSDVPSDDDQVDLSMARGFTRLMGSVDDAEPIQSDDEMADEIRSFIQEQEEGAPGFHPGFDEGDNTETRARRLLYAVRNQILAFSSNTLEQLSFPVPRDSGSGYFAVYWPTLDLTPQPGLYIRMTLLVILIANAFNTGTYLYLRELIYEFPSLWGRGYRIITETLELVQKLLGAPHRSDLNIRSEEGSVLVGAGVTFKLRGTGTLVKSDAVDPINLPDPARVASFKIAGDLAWLLIIDKRCFVRVLADTRASELLLHFGKPGLIVGTNGMVDLATTHFLDAVQGWQYPPDQDPLTMFSLCDADGGGMIWMDLLLRGRPGNGLNGVTVHHLGLLPSRIPEFCLPASNRLVLSEVTKAKLANLANRLLERDPTPETEALRQETLALLRLGYGMYIQAVNHLTHLPGVHPYISFFVCMVQQWHQRQLEGEGQAA